MCNSRDVAIFFHGTCSTSKESAKSVLGKAATWLMHDDRDFILQLFKYCQVENKIILDGPGTDVVDESWSFGKFFKTVGGIADGSVGNAGINANLEKVKNYLREQAGPNKENILNLCAFGWSRGAYTIFLLKILIAELLKEGIKIIAAHFTCIDPVIGTPIDRIRSLFKSQIDPAVNLHINTYYSHSGNLNMWDSVSQFILPKQFHFNTTFFSGLLSNIRNMNLTIFSDNCAKYEYRSNSFLVPANHEGIIGRALDKKEELAGNVVLAHILLESPLAFDPSWTSRSIENGITSLIELRKQNISCENDRKFLETNRFFGCLLGRSLTRNDNIMSILDVQFPEMDCYSPERSFNAR